MSLSHYNVILKILPHITKYSMYVCICILLLYLFYATDINFAFELRNTFLTVVSTGDCHWLGYSSRDTSAPVLPLQSEVTAGDFIGHDPISREIHSPNAPEGAAEKILLSTKGGFIPRR